MAIVFHCEHCGKKIEAADSAGGKRGTCPVCHNKLYVPSPDLGDELKLAPIDETELEREKRLLAETHKIRHDILQETDIPDGQREQAGVAYEMSEKELKTNIIMYLRHMSYGKTDEADRIAALIAPCASMAIRIIDRIALSEIPEPELEDIPLQMISSSIRSLRSKLS